MTHFPTTITELRAGLKAGNFTAVELLEHTYQQIELLEPKVEAFLEINTQKAIALEAAQAADARGYGDDAPLLNGIPIAIKDNIVTQNLRTTAAS